MFKKYLWTGLKILAGLALGALSYLGLTKLEKKSGVGSVSTNSESKTSDLGSNFGVSEERPICSNERTENKSTKAEKVITSLNKTADIIQKIGAVAASITLIFGGRRNDAWGYGGGYNECFCSPHCARPYYGEEQPIVQLGSQVFDAGPPNSYYQQNQYKF